MEGPNISNSADLDGNFKLSINQLQFLLATSGELVAGSPYSTLPGRVMSKVEAVAKAAVGASKGTAYLIGHNFGRLYSFDQSGLGLKPGQMLQKGSFYVGEGIPGKVAATGQSCRVEELPNTPRGGETGADGVSSLLCSPIFLPRTAFDRYDPEALQSDVELPPAILGVVAVERKEPFNDEDEKIITQVCEVCGVWLTHMMVVLEEGIKARAAEAILNVIRLSYEGHDLVPMVDAIAQETMRITEAELVSLLFVDEYMQEIWVASSAGENSHNRVGMQIHLSKDHIPGYVAISGEIVNCDDLEADQEWSRPTSKHTLDNSTASEVGEEGFSAALLGRGARSILCVPIPCYVPNDMDEDAHDEGAESDTATSEIGSIPSSSPKSESGQGSNQSRSFSPRPVPSWSGSFRRLLSSSSMTSGRRRRQTSSASNPSEGSRSCSPSPVRSGTTTPTKARPRLLTRSGGKELSVSGSFGADSSQLTIDTSNRPTSLGAIRARSLNDCLGDKRTHVKQLSQHSISSQKSPAHTFPGGFSSSGTHWPSVKPPLACSSASSKGHPSASPVRTRRRPSLKPMAVLVLVNKRGGEVFDEIDEDYVIHFCHEVESVLRRKAVEAMLMKRALCERRQNAQTSLQSDLSAFQFTGKNEGVGHLMVSITPPQQSFLPKQPALQRIESAMIAQFTEKTALQRMQSLARSNPGQTHMRSMSTPHTDTPLHIETSIELDSWDLDVFNLSSEDMYSLVRAMFLRLRLIQKYGIKEDILHNFYQAVQSSYHDHPFHNFIHGFSVMHMTYMIVTNGAIEFLTKLDLLSALIGSLCHDIDHPGHNNAFEVNSMSDLALTHADDAVLERHHIHRTFEVLLQEENNIIAELRERNKLQFQELRRIVIKIVLGTDMAKHTQHVDLLNSRVQKLGNPKPTERYRNRTSIGFSTPALNSDLKFHRSYTDLKTALMSETPTPRSPLQINTSGSELEEDAELGPDLALRAYERYSPGTKGKAKIMWSNSPRNVSSGSFKDKDDTVEAASSNINDGVSRSPSPEFFKISPRIMQSQKARRRFSAVETPNIPKLLLAPSPRSRSNNNSRMSTGRQLSSPQVCASPMPPFSRDEPEDRGLLLAAVVHCADLTGQVMPKKLALEWGRRVLSEFKAQAEKEERLGLPMTFSTNSSEVDLVKGQIFFLEKIVEPLFSSLVTIFPDCKAFTKNLRDNQKYYSEESKRLQERERDQSEHSGTSSPLLMDDMTLVMEDMEEIHLYKEDEAIMTNKDSDQPKNQKSLFFKPIQSDEANGRGRISKRLSPEHEQKADGRCFQRSSVSPHRTESPTGRKLSWRKNKKLDESLADKSRI